MSTPFLIALCGYPQAGKSTVQKILQDRYGAVAADDGRPLREAAKVLYGLTDWHVYTQDGKASEITIAGKTVTVRQLLGDLGVALDTLHGPDFIPWAAIQSATGISPDPQGCLVFGSVRRGQGRVYRDHGGIVVEIRRPGCGPVYDFDVYDASLCTHRIDNGTDGCPITLDELEKRTVALFDDVFAARRETHDAA